MIALLLLAVVVVLVVVLVVRRPRGPSAGAGLEGHAVRRAFQYLLLLGLLVVSAVGLSGLLGRLLEGDLMVAGDEAALARDLAFTVVGGPLLAGVALWSRRTLAADPGERRSLVWAAYVTAACLLAVLVTMTGASEVLRWAVGLVDFSGFALAQALVWGVVWGTHWWVEARTSPPERSRVHHLLGSLIGLVAAASGLGRLLAGALRTLVGLDGVDAVLAVGGSPMLQGLVTLVVAAPVWLAYWERTASRQERDTPWLAYVLLVGVAGGLVTAIVAASVLLHTVLVWLVGDPGPVSAAEHFSGAPGATAATAVGVLVWWYHHAVLESGGLPERTEVRRVYEYLMAGIGLLAAAGGLITVLAALVEAATGTTLVGAGATNTLLAAFTLLVVGGPVWWVYWHQAQEAVREAPATETASPTRRVYLFVLFGVGGVAAVVALIVGMYLLFQDFVSGTLGEQTLRSMRFPIGVLLTTAAVAAYHWTVYRADRAQVPEAVEAHGPRYVLLVGPADDTIASEVARRTHARVHAWTRTDDGLGPWSVEEVMRALEGSPADEVVVVAGPGGVSAIPVRRH